MQLVTVLLGCQALPAHHLTERSAAAIAAATELAGFKQRVRLLEVSEFIRVV